MDFNQPGASSGDKLELENYVGKLLLIYPKEVKVAVATSFGPKDPLVADIVILETGEELRDAFIFAGVMIGQLKGYIGNPNPALGRLGYGVAKPGQKPPYQLLDFTEADAQMASAWVHSHPLAFNAPAALHPVTQTQGVLPNNGYSAGGYVAPQDHQAQAAAQALEQQRAAQSVAAQFTQSAPPAGVNTTTGEVGGAVNFDTVKQLLGLGLPDADIAKNTGATMEQVAALRNLPVS